MRGGLDTRPVMSLLALYLCRLGILIRGNHIPPGRQKVGKHVATPGRVVLISEIRTVDNVLVRAPVQSSRSDISESVLMALANG